MAGGMDLGSSGKGGKKPLDTAINLVPFIDLMAVTISFLIMTAVWTQIGRLQVSSSGDSGDPSEQQDDKTVPVTLVVTPTELKLTAGQQDYGVIQVTRDDKQRMDLTKLSDQFKELRKQLPEQNTITVQAGDALHYEDLVRVIDEAIGAGLPNVSVAAAQG
jgi:biopolymer transport protein ExbD